MQLHWLHVARKAEITGVMHGKNTVLSARAVSRSCLGVLIVGLSGHTVRVKVG